MQKSTSQDGEPDVDQEERNKLRSTQESPENDTMLRSNNATLHKDLLQELGARFQNSENESSRLEEVQPEEEVFELNNNGEGNAEQTRLEASNSQSATDSDTKINKYHADYDWEMGNEEVMIRTTKWSSLKKKVKDKLTRNSYSGCYTVSDGITPQKHSMHTLPNQVSNSQWYTKEADKIAFTEGDRLKPTLTTYPKPDLEVSAPGLNFTQSQGAVYTCSVQFHHRKYLDRSGFSDCFLSAPLKVFDDKLCLKIRMNKRREGRGFLSIRMCPASDPGEEIREADPDFSLDDYPHRRTLVVELPSQSPVTFVDEPPFGEDLNRKWAEEAYWHPKEIPHRLIERQQQNPIIRLHLIVEPLRPLLQCFESDNGILLWKIRNFRQMLQEEMEGLRECSLSPYFYSHSRGYRMRARLFLNGAGPARWRHMSVFLDFLTGRWDDCLPSSITQFPHQTTFTVLDQSENERKMDLSRTEVNTRGFGAGDFFYDFVNLASIQEEVHIRRDTMVLRIVVNPIDLARDSTWKAPFVAPPRPPVPSRPSRT